MELLLGTILGVAITFFALFLMKKLRMADDKLQKELNRDLQMERLLLQLAHELELEVSKFIVIISVPIFNCISHRSRHRN